MTQGLWQIMCQGLTPLSLLSKITIIGQCEGKRDSLTYSLKNSYTRYGPCTDHWGYYGQNGNYYNIANINFLPNSTRMMSLAILL